jgi:hypothetical protein
MGYLRWSSERPCDCEVAPSRRGPTVHSASQDGRAAGVPYGLVAEAPPQLLREVSQPDSMLLRIMLRNRIIYLYL